jgi:hypothetical protein
MVLHSAAHSFQDGEIKGALRDVLDIHEMLLDFGKAPGFWADLLARAEQLQLGRPLYYAVSTSQALLGTPIPGPTLRAVQCFGPNPLTKSLMASLIRQVLEPRYPYRDEARLAAWLLYIRSHWLKMPPGLLGAHLARKAWQRTTEARRSSPAPGSRQAR